LANFAPFFYYNWCHNWQIAHGWPKAVFLACGALPTGALLRDSSQHQRVPLPLTILELFTPYPEDCRWGIRDMDHIFPPLFGIRA